jgi:hypothetical protein
MVTRSSVRALLRAGERAAPAGVLAPHWRRNGFATWLFQPAASGRYSVREAAEVIAASFEHCQQNALTSASSARWVGYVPDAM